MRNQRRAPERASRDRLPDLGGPVNPSASGRLYFWGERALYVGPDVTATLHAHHAVQVIVPLSGIVRLRTGAGARWRLYEGVVISSNQLHETDPPAALVASLWFEPDTPEAQRLGQTGTALAVTPIERLKLSKVVPHLLDCLRERCDAQRAAALVDEVVQILAPARPPRPETDARVLRAREVLGSAPGRRMPLAEVAATVSLSPSRLAHLFSARMGMPARRYLLWLRLRDAVGELTRGLSITEAAHAAGFADAAHLTRTFRRMLGFTPSTALQISKFVQDAPVRR